MKAEFPDFEIGRLNPLLSSRGIGEAFEAFVYELLQPDFPGLHIFSGAGKDGAIDVSQTADSARTVAECKYIGSGKYDDAVVRWQEVARNLGEHLANPLGPTKGQPQYWPWYRTDPTIIRLLFCFNAAPKQAQRDALHELIRGHLSALGETHSHLVHLKSVEVELVDWNDCTARLRRLPHLIFRWFPETRPEGLVPLEDSPQIGTFRSYLLNAKLPFYSRAKHAENNPQIENPLLNEEGILQLLEETDLAGVVITGRGGVGKTRQTLELGWIALKKGWLVLRAQSRLRREAVEKLTERITPETKTLLLVDYIETQHDFEGVIEYLQDLNSTYRFRLRFAANCRNTYYSAVEHVAPHIRLNLSPPGDDSEAHFYRSYHQASVKHILESCGIHVTEQHTLICRDVAILAVFMVFLHSTGKIPDLEELLREPDFGQWVGKRVHLSFPTWPIQQIRRELALLAPLFPMSGDSVSKLDTVRHRPLFDRLAADGWIEKLDSEDADSANPTAWWVMAHDVLADQILLSQLSDVSDTAAAFIEEIVASSEDSGCLRSSLLTCQRLGEHHLFGNVRWVHLVSRRLASNLSFWKPVRHLLIRSSLLTPLEKLSIVTDHPQLWGPGSDPTLGVTVRYLAKWAVTEGKKEVEPGIRNTLVDLLLKSDSSSTTANLLWGLKLAPAEVTPVAEKWLLGADLPYRAHLLFVFAMQNALWTSEIEVAFARWLHKFQSAGLLFSLAIETWLNETGSTERIKESMQHWLRFHRHRVHAGIVFKSWLRAGGDLSSIQEYALTWLHENRTSQRVNFLLKYVCKEPLLAPQTVKDVLDWCRAFPDDEDALWRITQLGANLLNYELAQNIYEAAQLLLKRAIDPNTTIDEVKSSQITTLLSYLFENARIHSMKMRVNVDSLIVLWLKHPNSFGRSPKPHRNIQRIGFARQVLLLYRIGDLAFSHDRASLVRFLNWLDEWEAIRKERLRPTIEAYSKRYPDSEVWKIVALD
jgi:hypothetical protein